VVRYDEYASKRGGVGVVRSGRRGQADGESHGEKTDVGVEPKEEVPDVRRGMSTVLRTGT